MTRPCTIRPASVALSSTSSAGARPIHSKMRRSPSQRHSERSENIAVQKRALEWGRVRTSSFMSRATPAISQRKLPKSTWAAPGAHSSSR